MLNSGSGAESMSDLVQLFGLQKRASPLLSEAMFAGPYVLPFLIDEEAAGASSSIHVVVGRILNQGEFDILCGELRNLGFEYDAQLQVWTDTKVSFELYVCPFQGAGNYNAWYEAALASCMRIERETHKDSICLIDSAYFLAAGLEAALVQTRDEFLGDMLVFVARAPNLLELLQAAPHALRAFVATKIRILLDDPAFERRVSALSPTINGDSLRARCEGIASMLPSCDPGDVLAALLREGPPQRAVSLVPEDAVAFPGSKSVRFAQYDKRRSMLTIGFLGDRVYDYYAVPEKVFSQLCEAERPGSYINEAIKDQYPYRERT